MKNIAVTKSIAKFIFVIILLFNLSTQAFSQSIAINMGGQEIALINSNRSLVTNNGNNGLSAGSVWRYDNLITTGGITVYGILTITAMNNSPYAINELN